MIRIYKLQQKKLEKIKLNLKVHFTESSIIYCQNEINQLF